MVCRRLIRHTLIVLAWMLLNTQLQSVHADEQSDFTKTVSSYFNNYCIDCHGADEQMAGIAVHKVGSQTELLQQRKSWQRVLKIVELGAMPPEDIDERPTAGENKVVADLLEDALYNFDCQQVARPGHPIIRRLNRVEYNNTIRDLFDVAITPADDFPSDDVGEGFDNIGGVLSISPLLMEKYLTAAEQVTAAVIDTTDYTIPQTWATESNKLIASHENTEDVQGLRFLKQTGELAFEQSVPSTGKYQITFDAEAMPQNNLKIDFVVKVGDETVKDYSIRQRNQPKKFKRKIELTAGTHRIAFEFEGDDSDEDELQHPRFGMGRVVIHGPIGESTPNYSEIHRRIVTVTPSDKLPVQQAARTLVSPLLRRVFRRPVSDAETDRFAGLTVSFMEEQKATWEQAVAATVQAMLVSPEFLFRVEQEPSANETSRQINDHELAVRLSYFLWSSLPDEELFRVAEEGQLHDRAVLAVQIRRMIADDRSQALVDNFAVQWLNLRNLEDSRPDPEVFSEFNEKLRGFMLQETSLVFRSIMTQDRNIEELLSGESTWINEPLAAHYGIEGVIGEEFVEVSLTETPRRGVLSHASILTLTSYPQRTSPVQRGKWILENIFGEGPPPPPLGVPELEESAKDAPELSLREKMAIHRTNSVCASCHQMMDPLGMGLENFDAIGRWRDEDRGKPVDARGELPDGQTFEGPQELIQILLSRREDFIRTLTGKMLVYATGRGLEYYDQCVVDDCVEQMSHHNNRFSSLVEAIVLSDAFMKRGHAE